MYDIFLSYSRKDNSHMQQVHQLLSEQGFNIWTDDNLIAGTPEWEAEIETALNNTACLVVLLSPDAKASKWVKREIGYADERNIPIFPLLVNGDELNAVPLRLVSVQRIDARTDMAQAVLELVAVLRDSLRPTKTAHPIAQKPARPADFFAYLGKIEQLSPKHAWEDFDALYVLALDAAGDDPSLQKQIRQLQQKALAERNQQTKQILAEAERYARQKPPRVDWVLALLTEVNQTAPKPDEWHIQRQTIFGLIREAALERLQADLSQLTKTADQMTWRDVHRQLDQIEQWVGDLAELKPKIAEAHKHLFEQRQAMLSQLLGYVDNYLEMSPPDYKAAQGMLDGYRHLAFDPDALPANYSYHQTRIQTEWQQAEHHKREREVQDYIARLKIEEHDRPWEDLAQILAWAKDAAGEQKDLAKLVDRYGKQMMERRNLLVMQLVKEAVEATKKKPPDYAAMNALLDRAEHLAVDLKALLDLEYQFPQVKANRKRPIYKSLQKLIKRL